MAIVSWIVFTVAIGLIKPPPHSCWKEMNATHQIIERVGYSYSTSIPTVKVILKRQTVSLSTSSLNKTKDTINERMRIVESTVSTKTIASSRRRKIPIRTTTLSSKLIEEDDDIENNRITTQTSYKQIFNAMNFIPNNKSRKTMGNPLLIKHTNISLVKPLASPILYEKKDVRNVFMVFLLLIIVGEFFSAPAITLAVSKCTLD